MGTSSWWVEGAVFSIRGSLNLAKHSLFTPNTAWWGRYKDLIASKTPNQNNYAFPFGRSLTRRRLDRQQSTRKPQSFRETKSVWLQCRGGPFSRVGRFPKHSWSNFGASNLRVLLPKWNPLLAHFTFPKPHIFHATVGSFGSSSSPPTLPVEPKLESVVSFGVSIRQEGRPMGDWSSGGAEV